MHHNFVAMIKIADNKSDRANMIIITRRFIFNLQHSKLIFQIKTVSWEKEQKIDTYHFSQRTVHTVISYFVKLCSMHG